MPQMNSFMLKSGIQKIEAADCSHVFTFKETQTVHMYTCIMVVAIPDRSFGWLAFHPHTFATGMR